MTDKLLSRPEAAEHLGIALPTLDRLTLTSEIIPLRIGRRVLFEPEELERFVKYQRLQTCREMLCR